MLEIPSSVAFSSRREKQAKETEANNDDLPLAIQTFLWRQTSPFIRPKFGKFHHNTCVPCQNLGNESVREIKECCKIFEKVIVQNILFGLSPSFTNALQSIPRWRFIVATLPHIMHCAASMLQYRKESNFTLGTAEGKLLHTLHWILLDAADECALAMGNEGKLDSTTFAYLFPITAITTFIYLFAPICTNVREADFLQSFRLESGKKIWQAMWEFRHPDAECFTSPVKPRRSTIKDLKKIREKQAKNDPQKNYQGEGDAPGSPIVKPPPKSQTKNKWLKITRKGLLVSAIGRMAERKATENAKAATSTEQNGATVATTTTTTTAATIETATTSSSSNNKPAFIAVVAALRSAAAAEKAAQQQQKSDTVEAAPASAAASDVASSKSQPSSVVKAASGIEEKSETKASAVASSISEASATENKLNTPCGVPGVPSESENALATYLDVAVMRCLFISHWTEEGFFWALMFLNRRLKGITCGITTEPPPRKRSNSLPMPKIEANVATSGNSTSGKKSQLTSNGLGSDLSSDFHPVKRCSSMSGTSRKKSVGATGTEGKFKTFKTFVESKILSKSNRSLDADNNSEKAESEVNKQQQQNGTKPNVPQSVLTARDTFLRRSSRTSFTEIDMLTKLDPASAAAAKGKNYATVEEPESELGAPGKDMRLVKGKSMPSLRYYGMRKQSHNIPPKATLQPPVPQVGKKMPVARPIITVTEFTPGNTPDQMSANSGSIGSRNGPLAESPCNAKNGVDHTSNGGQKRIPLYRSRTDSVITYTPPSIGEAPGSTFYIRKNGQIDYMVLLKALHKISLRENVCTVRVCEVLLSLTSTLIDLGVLANKTKALLLSSLVNPDNKPTTSNNEEASSAGPNDKEKSPENTEQLSLHNTFMDIVIRVLKILGCNHGCHDMMRPPGGAGGVHVPVSSTETLRNRGVALLSRLLWYDKKQFKQFMATLAENRDLTFLVTFLHGYLGFCADPNNPFSTSATNVSSSTLLHRVKPMKNGNKNPAGNDLSSSYANNFEADPGSSQNIESLFIHTMFKKMVSRMTEKMIWIKSPEQSAIYNDCRSLINHVKIYYGGVFRRVTLSGIMESTKQLVKTQYKVETGGHNHIGRIPCTGGSYPNIESRDSPVGGGSSCNYVDETNVMAAVSNAAQNESKLAYKKSVFKKKSTSSTATSLVEGAESPMTRGSPAGSLNKKHFVHNSRSEANIAAAVNAGLIQPDRKVSRMQMAINWITGKSGSHEGDHRSETDGEKAPVPPLASNTAEVAASDQLSSTSGGPQRKYSIYAKTSKLQKGTSKQIIKMAKKTLTEKMGMTRGRKREMDSEDALYEISRCNSYDFDAGITRDSDTVFFKERHLVPSAVVLSGLARFNLMLDMNGPGTVPDPLLIAALIDLPKAPVVTRACYLLECAHHVYQCNRGQWPSWLKINLPAGGSRPSRGTSLIQTQPLATRRSISMQLQASKMFHQWGEMLGSRIEELLAEETEANGGFAVITDEAKQRQLLLEDEEEDFMDEASVNPNGSSCPMALRLIACVLLLEITTFMRETYKSLPKMHQRSLFPNQPQASANANVNTRASHCWPSVGNANEERPPPPVARSASQAVVPHLTPAQAASNNVGSSGGAQASSRRWSMATQSVGNASLTSSSAAQGSLEKQPSLQSQVPPETMAALVNNTHGNSTGENRKISFVIQDNPAGEAESKTSSQTTLAMQAEEEKRGARITQGKPFLKRNTSNRSSGSFRRRSIRLTKTEGGAQQTRRVKSRDSDAESATTSSITNPVVTTTPSATASNNRVVSPPCPSANLTNTVPVKKPSVTKARSRWNKLTGTAMFINRLALNRADSSASTTKRKVSSISASDTSEHEVQDAISPTSEEPPNVFPPPNEEKTEKDLLESHLFDLPNEEDHLEQNMPWLRVMTKLLNGFNYHCTHQTFCHPMCYRRQMRAARRLMEATRNIYGEEIEYAEDIFSSGDRGGGVTRQPSKKGKNNYGDSSSTSPERNRKDDIDVERGGGSLHQLQMHQFQQKVSSCLQQDQGKEDEEQRKSTLRVGPKRPPGGIGSPSSHILKYLQIRIRNLFHVPLSVLNKSACILSDAAFIEVLPVAWELLRESDRDVVAAASTILIVSSVKVAKQTLELIKSELHHQLPDQRINALQRFQALWRNRFQVWQRLEENGQIAMKVVPSQIEFTLPSPKLGIESLPIIDPPWVPRTKTKISAIHDSGQMLLSATKSRKKQQAEAVQSVIHAEAEKRRKERENFHITSVPVLVRAAHEPSLYNGSSEDHEEDVESTDQEKTTASKSTVHMAQTLFPSMLCTSFVEVIKLLDDHAVSLDGTAVYEVAYQIIWSCLVEDSNLFLKYFMEQLTREKSVETFQIIRKMIRFIPKLPQQAAFSLYNYIIGYIMFYVRHPREKGLELIGQALATLWMVVHSVQGIMFKDLKQILRKEQVDASILLTANVPAAKKIIVHGPQGPDEGGIPSQFPLGEDVQFIQILREAQDFFGIEEEQAKEYFLVDHRTRMIHNPQHYARDFYFFKRAQYPQLSLVHKKPAQAFLELQKQCFLHKFVEIGKVMLTWGILKNVNHVVQRVVFLHEDLMKLPSFPRKALEAELDLYVNGEIGKELLGLDVLHKFNWIRLIARMFEAMAGNFAYAHDIHLFINVINGSLALHAEDACILRYCMATIINASHQFKTIFSHNGFFLVMPSMLRIYSNNQTNELITKTIEFVCKQLYILHRKPFLLQMFGSVAPILEKDDDEAVYGDAFKVQPKYLYKLLTSLSENQRDLLHIMELVRMKKPLTALDFCYQGEPETISILECISLCVLVVAYDSGTKRARQMLTVLEAIMPYFLRDLMRKKSSDPKATRETIHQLNVTMKALVNNCDELTKNYTGPTNAGGDERRSRNYGSRGQYSPVIEIDEDSHSKFITEPRGGRGGGNSGVNQGITEEPEEVEYKLDRHCQPRNSLLSLISDFIIKCTAKLTEINKKDRQDKSTELLDNKCYMKLVEVAHSLLKMAPYDQECIKSKGLQKYMNQVFPLTDWSLEAMRPSLTTIIRRLDKFFSKMHKSVKLYQAVEWKAAAGLLNAVYITLWKHPYIVNVPNLKSLIGTCQCLVVGEESLTSLTDHHTPTGRRPELPPQSFCSIVFKLIALQVLVLGNAFTLEQRLQLADHQVQGSSSMHNLLVHNKGESMMLNLVLPLCLKIGCGNKDDPKLRKTDIRFVLNLLLNMINPHKKGRSTNYEVNNANNGASLGANLAVGGAPSNRSSSVQYNPSGDARTRIKTSSLEIAFLGIKILLVCYESQLNKEWFRIARTIKEMGNRSGTSETIIVLGDVAPLWRFLDFIAMHRSPLYTLLLPFIHARVDMPPDTEHEKSFQLGAKERLATSVVQGGRSKNLLLAELGQELASQRDSLNKRLQEAYLDVTIKSGSSIMRGTPRGSTHRTSFIDYVSEVYNSRAGHSSNQAEGLSVKGHSVSSSSVASAGSSLARDFSIRSENVTSNRVLSGRPRNRETTKSARLAAGSRPTMADKILRRTSYGGEQPETLEPAGISTVRQKKAASNSEPKLFKTNVFSRQKAMRHTFRFSKQDSVTSETSRQCSDGSEMSERSKLQRHKAGSRKTFKFRKTRKEMRKLKTTSEPLETTESALEMQQGNTIILNPALHSAAANLTENKKQKGSKKPPALVLSNVAPGQNPPIYSASSPGWKVTFPDIEIHSPKEPTQPDNVSISSRGTSSTVGYSVSEGGVKWDSFGENDEGGVLSLQERLQSNGDRKSGSSRPSSSAASSDRPASSATLVATPSSSSNSSVILQTTRDNFTSSQARRKNYIIFEQNDEDTLI